ncbi:MAG: hypothetical protein V3T88_06275 [Nitrosomonadaceae bacterium]
MATLAELRTLILAKLEDGDIQNPTSAQVTDQINSTIDYYETSEFWFGEDIATLTATIGNPVLDISSVTDFYQEIQPNGLVVLESNVRYPLVKLTPLEYDTINVDSTGLPRWYTFRDSQFELLFFPDQAYTVFLYYRKSYVDLVADGDTNDFTINTPRLIEYKTLADVLRDYRSDFERAAVYEQKVVDELAQIKTQSYNRSARGFLSTENIVDRGSKHNNYYFGY